MTTPELSTGEAPIRTSRSITVLEATGAPNGTTRYVDQVVTHAASDIRFEFLSLRALLSMRYDVLHLHWPEVLVRAGSRPETWLRSAGLIGLIALLKLRRVAIVRTLHNRAPHEPGSPVERATLRVLDRATDYVVTINRVTPVPNGRGTYIAHGHYRDRFAHHPRSLQVKNRILYAGLIRPYKGVEQLLEAFAGLEHSDVSLRIVGRPSTDLRDVVVAAAAADERITHRLEFVSDEELVAEMSKAELVCLPYRELDNSGMLLVALSLERPVLVPDTPASRLLEQEVGAGWIYRFTGSLESVDVERALCAAQTDRGGTGPNLAERDWPLVAGRYAAAFREALTITGRVPRESA